MYLRFTPIDAAHCKELVLGLTKRTVPPLRPRTLVISSKIKLRICGNFMVELKSLLISWKLLRAILASKSDVASSPCVLKLARKKSFLLKVTVHHLLS